MPTTANAAPLERGRSTSQLNLNRMQRLRVNSFDDEELPMSLLSLKVRRCKLSA